MFAHKTLYVALLGLVCVQPALAQEIGDLADGVMDNTAQNVVELEALYATLLKTQGAPLGKKSSVSEHNIKADTLKKRGTNIGDALSGELGIHANQFGSGASAPIIRGQGGKRIKILNSGSETLDMASMSPDHAVTVDSVLARQVEVLRGANTLLYSSGNSAGVINVVDNKIPTTVPNAPTGEALIRTNSADKERLANFSVQLPIGQNIAISTQGMYKKNRRLPDTKLRLSRQNA